MVFPEFPFLPSASCPVTGHYGKEPVPILCAPFRQVFTLISFPQAFLPPGWAVPALLASCCMSDAPVSSWSFAGLFPVCSCLSRTAESRTGPSTPHVASPVLSRAEDGPAGDALPNATQDAVGHRLCCKVTLPAHGLSCCPPGPQASSQQSCFPVSQPPAHTGAWGFSLPRSRTLCLPLLNCIRFLSAQFSSLWRSLWMATHPPGLPNTPPLLRYAPSSRSLMLNSTNHSCIGYNTAMLGHGRPGRKLICVK